MQRTGKKLRRMRFPFQLPAEFRMGMADVQIIEMGAIAVTGHRGLLSFSGENAQIAIRGGVLVIWGKRLRVESMTMEEVRLRGSILSVERRE